MNKYNLDHLNQDIHQNVSGPIQDDEALLLYAMIKCMDIRRILEIGALHGYSAKNFIKAMNSGILYSVDVNIFQKQSDNHKVLIKNAEDITPDDLDNQPLDLVFFDCHNYQAQMQLYYNLSNNNLIKNETILVLHDTALHFTQQVPSIRIDDGYMHQATERKMVNNFRDLGYNILNFHPFNKPNPIVLHRHGLTICQKNDKLKLNA